MNPTPTTDTQRLRELLKPQIQRYELTEHCRGMDCWGQMEKNDDGEYVLYSDIAALRNEAPALLDELERLRKDQEYRIAAMEADKAIIRDLSKHNDDLDLQLSQVDPILDKFRAERDKLREEVERLQKDRDGWVEAAAQRLREKIAALARIDALEAASIRDLSERDSLRRENEDLKAKLK